MHTKSNEFFFSLSVCLVWWYESVCVCVCEVFFHFIPFKLSFLLRFLKNWRDEKQVFNVWGKTVMKISFYIYFFLLLLWFAYVQFTLVWFGLDWFGFPLCICIILDRSQEKEFTRAVHTYTLTLTHIHTPFWRQLSQTD